MGTAYKIRCKHCGTQVEHYMRTGYGSKPSCSGRAYVETETSIRCPVCLRRMNNSQREFHEQTEVTYLWD